MWRCENCGANVQSGTVCPACGRPLDDALAEIGQKVQRLRFFSEVSQRWTDSGVVIGFLTGIVLPPVLAVTWIGRCLSGPDGARQLTDAFPYLVVFFLVTPIFLPLFFGSIAFALATVVRPICVALFCSVERFEQEYGPSRK